MPLYEYQCDSCDHRFEVIQKFSDAPIETCPNCGGTVQKLLSSPAIQFKGSGWYITDYARSGKSDDKSSGHGKAAKGDSSESKGESSGASTPESKASPSTESTPTATPSKPD